MDGIRVCCEQQESALPRKGPPGHLGSLWGVRWALEQLVGAPQLAC